MKNLLLISTLFIGVNCFSQSDTIIYFEKEITNKYYPIVMSESKYITIDTLDFESSEDYLCWKNSKWIIKDSVYVNASRYIIRQIQYRMNDQGIKQKKRRLIQYTKTTRIRRRIKK